MDGIARSIRVVIGLGMIAAGSSLAAPAGIEVVGWWRSGPSADAARPLAAVAVADAGVGAANADGGPLDQVGAWPVEPAHPAASPRADYVPPPPPAPLPAAPPALAAAGPDLAAHYRTTLAVPPPPLLDGQRPPPLAVGWAARGGVGSAAPPAPMQPQPAGRYRVRDGDDLTAIAIRFYGTPAAAPAIWDANRGILRDPGLLPIGAELVLPPPGSVALGYGRGQRQSIEPPMAQPIVAPPGVPAATASWLQPQ